MGSSIYQTRFWNHLDQLKQHTYYVEDYLLQTERVENYINVFLAIVTNASICTWAIWKKMDTLWAALIALSQLVNAVKPHLIYSKRIKALRGLYNELDDIFNYFEIKWYSIAEGELTEKEIAELCSDLNKRKSQASRKHLDSFSLPEKKHLMAKAEDKTKVFFSCY